MSMEKFPALHQQGQRNLSFSWKCIAGWILNGVLSSLAIFTMTICLLSPAAFREDGQVPDNTHVGTIMYTCVIWTVNCQIALITANFTWISHVLVWGSILCWYIYLFICGILPPKYSQGGFHILTEAIGNGPMYWLVTLLVVVVSLLPYFAHSIIQRIFYPMDDQVIQEMKYCRKDIIDYPMWLEKQQKSKTTTHVGFSSRVDAKIRHSKQQSHRKKKLAWEFVANSALDKSIH